MDKINVLKNNGISASIRQRSQTAIQAYIRVSLVTLKQVWHNPGQQQRGINKDLFTLVCDYLLYWRSILV